MDRAAWPSLYDNTSWTTRGKNARELLIQALVFEAKMLVVEAEQVEHGRVEVADVDGIFHDVVGEIVGLAVDRRRL